MRWFDALFRKDRLERQLDAELRFHFEQQVKDRVAAGLDPGEARRRVRLEFGGIEQLKEECRDVRRLHFLEDALQDLRYGLRFLRRSPGFTLVAILSLALGIGANTAIYSVINAFLLRPLPVPEANRLVQLTITPREEGFAFSYPLFDFVRAHNQVFSGILGWANVSLELKAGGDAQRVATVMANGDYFTALGASASLGRTFTPADDKAGGGSQGYVAVLGDQFWSRQFGRSPSAVGRRIVLNGIGFTIVGVMPPGFFGAEVGARPDVFVPLQSDRDVKAVNCLNNNKGCWWLVVMARLKPGIGEEQARAQLGVLSPAAFLASVPSGLTGDARKDFLAQKVTAQSGAAGFSFLRYRFSNPLAILMVLVGLILLIACANLASLLLARATARQKEITIRLALGASRRRLIRQLLTESLILACIGGLAGLFLASWLAKSLVNFLSTQQEPILLDLSPDWRVLSFVSAAILTATILFGAAPAFRATRFAKAPEPQRRRPLARLLLTGQVALSVLLVTGAGLFAGSLFKLRSVDPGFDARGVVLFDFDAGGRPEKGAALAALYDRLMDRVRSLPGVKAVSLLKVTPLCNCGWTSTVAVSGQPERKVYLQGISPGYFAMMGTRLLAGRDFTSHDTRAVILNEKAVRTLFPRGDWVGARLTIAGDTVEVVGVAADFKYMNLRDEVPVEAFLPHMYKLESLSSMTIGVRTSGDPSALIIAFRSILHEVAPGTAFPETKTLSDQIDGSLAMERLMASLTVFFGFLALLLTSIGLYGTLAYSVVRRTSEIGIRMALGADRRRVVWLVIHENLAVVAVGFCAGIAAVLAMSRLVASMLYGVQPRDPSTLVLAGLVFSAVAAAASLIPALRASRIDPMGALRYE